MNVFGQKHMQSRAILRLMKKKKGEDSGQEKRRTKEKIATALRNPGLS